MKISILSRGKIEKLAKNVFPPKTAVISITDFDLDFAELDNKPEYLLQIAFNDVDNDVFIDELGRMPNEAEHHIIETKYHMFTDALAVEIAEFYKDVEDKAEVIICQCEHGQSRSAAVAAAILEYRLKRGITVFADDRYYPNKMVFRKVLEQLKGGQKI